MSISNLFKPNDYNIHAKDYIGLNPGVPERHSFELTFGANVNIPYPSYLNINADLSIPSNAVKSSVNEYIAYGDFKLTDMSINVGTTGSRFNIEIDGVSVYEIDVVLNKTTVNNIVGVTVSAGSKITISHTLFINPGLCYFSLRFESLHDN